MAAANDVIKVAAIWRMWDYSQCVNTFHVKLAIGGDDVDIMNTISLWLEAGYYEFLGTISNTVAADRIEGYNVTQAYPMPVIPFPSITGGTSVGQRMPNGVCCLSLFRTGVNNVVGKKYWPPMTESDMDSGLWSNALLVNVNDGCVVFEQTYTVLGVDQFTPGVWRDAPNTFVPFISSITRAEPAYQRRRKPGRGS